jgi:hypothetical protein
VARASGKTTISAPADATWQVISDFGAACRHLAGVVNCTVEGKGVGALRTSTYADGTTIVERLEALDPVAHRLSYTLLSDTPFRNCLTTVMVRDLGQGQCEVAWAATFEADGLPESEAVEMLEGALTDNCLALKQFLER